MKFGVNTFIWTVSFDGSHNYLLPKIKAAGFDGVEVSLFHAADFATADIRKTGQQTPIIALTANAMAEDRNRCLAAGDLRSRSPFGNNRNPASARVHP